MNNHGRGPSALCIGLLLTAVAGALPAQVDDAVVYVNKTGSPKNGLFIRYNQDFAPGQPVLSNGGGPVVPPFLTTFQADGRTLILSGGSVPSGGRVPSAPGVTMSFQGTVSDAVMNLDQAIWLQNFQPTNTVLRFRIANRTGSLSDSMIITVLDAQGQALPIIDVDFTAGFQPAACPAVATGVPGTQVGVGLNCCVSGFDGDVGPIQLTLGSDEPASEVKVVWLGGGTKVGSAAQQPVRNNTFGDDPVSAAAGLSILTNIPATECHPRAGAGLDDLIGLCSLDLYWCNGTVPPGQGLTDDVMTVTSSDSGAEDIEIARVQWFRPVTSPVPELLYYVFDEGAGAAATANRAIPGVGSDPAPVNGQAVTPSLGQFGGALVGAGGTGATDHVDSGWPTSLGNGDWTVGVWLEVSENQIPSSMRLFGDPTAQFEAFVSGHDAVLYAAGTYVVLPGGAPHIGARVLAWVRDTTIPGIRGYIDGQLVVTVPLGLVNLNGAGTFKVGAAGPGAPALGAGIRIDEFRLYNRALSSAEIAAAFNQSLSAPSSIAQWQINGPEATMVVAGELGTEFAPPDVTLCVGENATLDLQSILGGLPWEVVFTQGCEAMEPLLFTPIEPLGNGAVIINVNVMSSQASSLFGFAFNVPFVPLAGSFIANVVADTYAQMVIVSPSQPEGFALSAPSGLHITDRGSGITVPGPAADDTFVEIQPGTQPLCGPASITFAGTAWSSLFVSSNGFVSFGAGSADPSPTVAEFASGPPRLAALWTDLDPGLGGAVTATAFQGAVVVSWHHVPLAGAAARRNVLEVVFEPNSGGCSISRFQPASGTFPGTLVGLSPGLGAATDPGPRLFSSLIGAGFQSGLATDMVYEFHPASAPSGFATIIFPNSDGSSFVVE